METTIKNIKEAIKNAKSESVRIKLRKKLKELEKNNTIQK
jgi:hypothetical protein